MNLILDTHVLLWWISGDARLGTEITALIRDERNSVRLIAATVWEISVKMRTGALRLKSTLEELLLTSLTRYRFSPLAITLDHAAEAGRLPAVHRDPFERMLIAQARIEELTLVTADETIFAYDVAAIHVGK